MSSVIARTIRIAAGAFALTFVIACGHTEESIPGSSAQKQIDAVIGARLRAYDPALKIEPSVCGAYLDVSNGKQNTCALVVDGVTLPVRVSYDAAAGEIFTELNGAFYERKRIDALIERTLLNSGDLVVAKCAGPVVRVIALGKHLSCPVDGLQEASSVDLKAMGGGKLFVYNPRGVDLKTPISEDLLARHKHGGRVVVSGAAVVAFIQQGFLESPSSRPTIESYSVSCPTRMDLTGQKRGTCAIVAKKYHVLQRMDIWIADPSGFNMRALDGIVNRDQVAEEIRKSAEQQAQANGVYAPASVDCGHGWVAAPIGKTFVCNAVGGAFRFEVTVTVVDARGTVRWRVNQAQQ